MYDVIVIGSGPAGEGAAISAAKHNLNVALVEAHSRVGGNCTFKGTIPSKALRHVVEKANSFERSAIFNPSSQPIKVSIPDVLKHVSKVIDKQVARRSSTFYRNDIDVIQGKASFSDRNTLNILKSDGSTDMVKAKTIIIATGSSPFNPNDIDFNHPRIYDSNTVLDMKEHPKSIIIYGAGVIGSEYASIFKGLGLRVTLINTRERLLSFLDDEVTHALSYHFINNGISVKHNESYSHINGCSNYVEVKLKSNKVLTADCLLFANGRSGNTNNLALDKVGLTTDSRGLLSVNDRYQTDVPNIYAIGDVIGYPSLASTSFEQGRVVGEHVACDSERKLSKTLPSGIYTIPDISFVGLTEQELTKDGVPYEIGKAHFKHLAGAQIADCEVGFIKILFCPDSFKVLGIHCFGERSAEIIHIGQAVMESSDNTIEYFANATFNYPTMAEAYRVAALNGINKLR